MMRIIDRATTIILSIPVTIILLSSVVTETIVTGKDPDEIMIEYKRAFGV